MGNFLSPHFQLCGKFTLFKGPCFGDRDTVRSEGEEKGVGKQKIQLAADEDSSYIPPSADANIVGMEDVMSQVLHYLDDATVRVVGIHGMGGVGKTTVAKQLIKRLRSSSSSPSTSAAGGQGSVNFDYRIWVTVSRNRDIGKLQKDIAVELGIHKRSEFKDEEDESTRARFISSYLSERRFLLVLDDVWEGINLSRIGIPEFQEGLGYKIVLTTREAKVCTDMDAGGSIVKVGCLGQEDSWELFKKTIKWEDDEFNARGVYKIARDIASKCGGLPLALITIARAMTTESNQGWSDAYYSLKDYDGENGMGDVYKSLEFSYQNLKSKEHQSCLLYSALFPEDEEILIERMVDYCIGGGSVSVDRNISGDIAGHRRRGRKIISELIGACLLERGEDEKHVKVHDAIRDMILFSPGRDNGENRIFSHAGKGIGGTHHVNVEEWRTASMLSFSRNRGTRELATEEEHGKFEALRIGKCGTNNLRVLLLDWNDIYELPRRLFDYCPNLRVLDLSHTKLRVIPASLCSLKSLQYLNLSDTEIKTLPKGMRKLSSLIQLDLSYTWVDKIPNGLFSSLSKLQSLNIFFCPFFSRGENRLQVLKELANLRLLEDVQLTIDGDDDDEVVYSLFYFVYSSITKLGIVRLDLSKWTECGILEKLEIEACQNGDAEDLVIDNLRFPRLKELDISDMNCRRIIPKNLQNLKELRISYCKGIVELMWPSILQMLESISISSCPTISSISSSPLQLNSLKILHIRNCPSLKDISMIESPHDLEIRCESKWWNDLRWENSGGFAPSSFIPLFLYD